LQRLNLKTIHLGNDWKFDIVNSKAVSNTFSSLFLNFKLSSLFIVRIGTLGVFNLYLCN
jgi:hypothetical protein